MFNDWIYQAIIEPLFEQFKCFLKAILTEANMFVRSIHLALSFCVILVASVEGLVVYGVILGSRTMDVDVLLTFLQKSKIIFACDY